MPTNRQDIASRSRSLTRSTGPQVGLPRPMRMEVLICTPPNSFRKRIPEPADGSKNTKDSDSLPKKLKRKRVIESGSAAANAETAPSSKKRKRKSRDLKDEAPPRRRRRLKRTSSDEAYSGDEVEPEHIIESRLRSRETVSKRDRDFSLAKLKRKRQGLPLQPEPEPELSDNSDDSESERDSLFDGSESDRSSDFIVEDDGNDEARLPKEFSMDAHEGLSHQFKKIFQFMVHLAVRPQIEREEFMREMLKNEEYFSIPFNVARRRISILGTSLVASERWTPALIALLKKYPVLDVRDLPSKSLAPCDACRIKGRRGCRVGELSGIPYNPLGFAVTIKKLWFNQPIYSALQDTTNSDEDADSDADESSDQSSDGDGSSATKNSCPKEGPRKELNLGRFCSERVKVFHQISHWEYDLFKCILQEVYQLHEAKQSSGIVNDRDVFVPVKYGDGKRPQDLHDADAINDWLVSRSLVDMQWAKIKLLLEKARNLEGKTD
ncbi:hypothetical protein B0H19DRAFT_1166546 [Mycena capillaripes]|nr:hypothetical protein B0H19DRAFT_1166546 [Mycena capillaripes]